MSSLNPPVYCPSRVVCQGPFKPVRRTFFGGAALGHMSAGLGVVWGTGLILPIALAPHSTTLALPFDPPSLRFLPAPRLKRI